MKILVIGKGLVGDRCIKAWDDASIADKRINSVSDVLELIERFQPNAILNAAGVRGKPNVDWCETHQTETIVGNTILPIYIAEACQQKNIYLLHVGSGCVYYGEPPDPKGWKENDFANPSAVYSRAKYAADLVLSTLPNVGIARIRMPIDYFPSPTNLIDKLTSYPKVVDVENSVTIMEDMINVFRALIEKKASGIFHVTNPGTVKHREIIGLYEQFVDQNHKNEWITNDDLLKQGLAVKGRSNNFLQSENLMMVGITMRPVKEALLDTMKKYARLKNKTS